MALLTESTSFVLAYKPAPPQIFVKPRTATDMCCPAGRDSPASSGGVTVCRGSGINDLSSAIFGVWCGN